MVNAGREAPLLIASKVEAETGVVAIELRVAPELKFFEGHFPGCSLLPGVVQLNWVVEFGRKHFSLPAKFKSLANIKFMRVITPGSTVQLILKFEPTRGELSFEYRIASHLCSSGAICFGA